MLPRWVYIYLVSKSMITERMSKDYQNYATIAAIARLMVSQIAFTPRFLEITRSIRIYSICVYLPTVQFHRHFQWIVFFCRKGKAHAIAIYGAVVLEMNGNHYQAHIILSHYGELFYCPYPRDLKDVWTCFIILSSDNATYENIT